MTLTLEADTAWARGNDEFAVEVRERAAAVLHVFEGEADSGLRCHDRAARRDIGVRGSGVSRGPGEAIARTAAVDVQRSAERAVVLGQGQVAVGGHVGNIRMQGE